MLMYLKGSIQTSRTHTMAILLIRTCLKWFWLRAPKWFYTWIPYLLFLCLLPPPPFLSLSLYPNLPLNVCAYVYMCVFLFAQCETTTIFYDHRVFIMTMPLNNYFVMYFTRKFRLQQWLSNFLHQNPFWQVK